MNRAAELPTLHGVGCNAWLAFALSFGFGVMHCRQLLPLSLMREMPVTRQLKSLSARNLRIRKTGDRPVCACLDNIAGGAVRIQHVETQLLLPRIIIGMHWQNLDARRHVAT